MLGGSAFSQLGIIVNSPGAIPRIIGTALPASSNFFINYVIIQVSLPHASRAHSPAVRLLLYGSHEGVRELTGSSGDLQRGSFTVAAAPAECHIVLGFS